MPPTSLIRQPSTRRARRMGGLSTSTLTTASTTKARQLGQSGGRPLVGADGGIRQDEPRMTDRFAVSRIPPRWIDCRRSRSWDFMRIAVT